MPDSDASGKAQRREADADGMTKRTSAYVRSPSCPRVADALCVCAIPRPDALSVRHARARAAALDRSHHKYVQSLDRRPSQQESTAQTSEDLWIASYSKRFGGVTCVISVHRVAWLMPGKSQGRPRATRLLGHWSSRNAGSVSKSSSPPTQRITAHKSPTSQRESHRGH